MNEDEKLEKDTILIVSMGGKLLSVSEKVYLDYMVNQIIDSKIKVFKC